MRVWLPAPAIVGLAAAAALAVAGCGASDLMLHPDVARAAARARPVDPAADGRAPRVVQVTNAAGFRLLGWLFESPGDRGVVLAAGGNATPLAHAYAYNRFLQGLGARVLLFSYQGFDGNEGPADLASLVGDWAAFHDLARRLAPGEPVVLVGQSIGAAGALCAAAAGPRPAGLVAEALPDLSRVAYAHVAEPWTLYPLLPFTLPAAAFVSATVPGSLDGARCAARAAFVPALFVHHPADRLTPIAQARRLFDAYAGPKRFVTSEAAGLSEPHAVLAADAAARAHVVAFVAARAGLAAGDARPLSARPLPAGRPRRARRRS